ncbi:MAG TPA: ankyrin repeat domain-containing protein, partial [Bryobacteraceae bacterium]|nr:ankyrin repeat domain-containing protein [Bryobacteraceae bacterium]
MQLGYGVLAILTLALPCAASDLHTAVRAGDIDRVRALLSAGASASERDALGGTALHDAAWSGELS